MAHLRHAAIAVLAFSCVLPLPAAALSFSNLFVFGDSIVDAGNDHDIATSLGIPDPTPAAEGYFDGRFTNGINPADVLSLAITGANSDNSLGGGTNYAYGGARARINVDPLPDLVAQVAEFTIDVGGAADPNALYVINSGGNDALDILDGGNATTIIDDAVDAISTSVLTLQGLGAQHILFVGVGDVGSAPTSNGDEVAGRNASIALNSAIQASLPSGVLFFNTMALFDAVIADPAGFGLPATLLTEVSCLDGGGAPPAGPPVCDAYAFFDDVHPTTQILKILGNELVATVPEPGTGLLVVFGLAAIATRAPSTARAGRVPASGGAGAGAS